MRRILVAIDGSEGALRALAVAMQQARLEPTAELHVLTVVPSLSNYTAAEIYLTAERFRQAAADKANSILEVAAERLKATGCRYTLEQGEGDPAESSLGILFLGSVAQRVVHHTTVPVTLVK